MKTHKKIIAITITITLILTGCAATGENLRGDVYKAGQVNTAQAAKTVKILAVLPAKIEVDNSKQRQQAQVGGGVLGAVLGGLGGGFGTHGNPLVTTATTLAGGAIGAGIGSMVAADVLVEGVSITYVSNNQTLNSAQVGKVCEFHPGTALLISTSPTETRIQANSVCPVAEK
jgi:outer membrane lipoprotein SlyB